MIRHDLSHWPLVISVAQGTSSLPDVETFQQEWSRWLVRGEPFATLRLFVDAEALVHPPGSAPLAKQWLQAHAQAVRERVMGMATVVPASEHARLSKMNAEKLFGVPAKIFSDVTAALDWLHERIYVPRNYSYDATAITGTITALVSAL